MEIRENGLLISVGWLVDKKMYFCGKALTVPHIVGLCTAPEFRFKGYAALLLNKMFDICADSPFITLYPFKHAFYKKFGFATVSFDFPAPENAEATATDLSYVEKTYSQFITRLDYYIDRTDADFRFYDSVFKCDGEGFLKIDDGFVCPDGYLPSKYKKTDKEGVMARIINVEKAMRLSGVNLDRPVTLKDFEIAKNNFSFTASNGRLQKSRLTGREITVSELTAAIFGQNENLKDIFPIKKGYLFDKY